MGKSTISMAIFNSFCMFTRPGSHQIVFKVPGDATGLFPRLGQCQAALRWVAFQRLRTIGGAGSGDPLGRDGHEFSQKMWASFMGNKKSREIPRNGVETCWNMVLDLLWICFGGLAPTVCGGARCGSPEGWGDWMQCRCSNALHAGCAWVPSQTSVSIRCCSPCLGRQYQLNRFFLFNELSRELNEYFYLPEISIWCHRCLLGC